MPKKWWRNQDISDSQSDESKYGKESAKGSKQDISASQSYEDKYGRSRTPPPHKWASHRRKGGGGNKFLFSFLLLIILVGVLGIPVWNRAADFEDVTSILEWKQALLAWPEDIESGFDSFNAWRSTEDEVEP